MVSISFEIFMCNCNIFKNLALIKFIFITDLYYSLCNSTNTYPNRANDILYNLILDHLTELNNGRQFYLSSFDNFNLPEILSQRPRDLGNGCSPFNNINMGKLDI